MTTATGRHPQCMTTGCDPQYNSPLCAALPTHRQFTRALSSYDPYITAYDDETIDVLCLRTQMNSHVMPAFTAYDDSTVHVLRPPCEDAIAYPVPSG